MTDILRARLVAFSVEDLKVKIKIFENIPGVSVIKYKPKFYGTDDSQLRNVTINFLWNSSKICELQIRLGDPPVLEEENHFLYEIERCQNPLQFLDAWNIKLSKMADNDELFYQI